LTPEPKDEEKPENEEKPKDEPAPAQASTPPANIIKLVALDSNGDPILDGDGKYTFSNASTEGSDAKYMALAFSPTETTFKPETKLDPQDGTVTISFADDTATGIDANTTADGSQDFNNSTQITVALGQVITTSTFDDYKSDNGEVFNVSIVDNSYSGTYSRVTTTSAKVETTITDSASDAVANESTDTIYVQLDTNATTVEATDAKLIHKLHLVDKDGNGVNLAVGESISVTLVYSLDTTEAEDFSSKNMSFTISGDGGSVYDLENVIADDYMIETSEGYTLKIASISDNSSSFENIAIADTINGANATVNEATGTITDETVVSDKDGVSVKLVATQSDGTIITDAVTIKEGDTAYYKAIVVDASDTQITTATGNVDITFTDDSAKRTGISAEGKLDFTGNDATVAINTVFSAVATDDYISDNNEKFNVQITDNTYTDTTTYEKVTHDTTPVVTTIEDEAIADENVDTVFVKIVHNDSQYEGIALTHTVSLVDSSGNALTIPSGNTITVDLSYSAGEPTDADFNGTKTTQVTLTNTNSSVTISNLSLDDFIQEGTETYTLTIDSVIDNNSVYEKIAIDSTDNSVTGEVKDGVYMGTPEDKAVDENSFDVTDANTTITNSGLLGVVAEDGDNTYSLTFDGNPTFTSNYGSCTVLNSNGTAIEYVVNGDTTTAYAGAGRTDSDKVFEITLNNNGINGSDDNYTYTQYQNIDHPDTNSDDDIVLTFGFKLNDGSASSNTATFNVTVNDSLPSGANQDIVVDEDGTKTIVISDESFKDGKITINSGVGGDVEIAKDATSNIYDTNLDDAIGTLTNNGDGTLTFTPTTNYSGATNGFTYDVLDSDGDSATASVTLSVTPKADAPIIADGANISTNEDTAVEIDLQAPTVGDATDLNDVAGSADGDYPELLGLISLDNMNSGVEILKGDNTLLWTSTGTSDKVYIKLNDGTHTSKAENNQLEDGTSVTVLTMSTAEFEALKVNPIAQGHRDIDVKMHVTEYEVDSNGNQLADADVVGTNGTTTDKTFHVEVESVTDNISLVFDSDTGGARS
ncbi:MAG: cadherin-like domain-containing protein, partial [Campylobacterota bacterium]|nr:cadherin-like domain-containing protein [Campylobacterota bacterium]